MADVNRFLRPFGVATSKGGDNIKTLGAGNSLSLKLGSERGPSIESQGLVLHTVDDARRGVERILMEFARGEE